MKNPATRKSEKHKLLQVIMYLTSRTNQEISPSQEQHNESFLSEDSFLQNCPVFILNTD